jgi:hypothetical protein
MTERCDAKATVNGITKRVSRLEVQLARGANNEPRDEHGRTTAERIWETRRSRMTKEELIVEEQRSAILSEACRGQTSMAEAIWRSDHRTNKIALRDLLSAVIGDHNSVLL